MPLRLYLDHHVPRAVRDGLRRRGVDVLTCAEDGTQVWSDPRVLDRAGDCGRVLVSQDRDLPAEAGRRQREGIGFAGVIYAHQLAINVGDFIDDLELVAKSSDPEEFSGCVLFLPL